MLFQDVLTYWLDLGVNGFRVDIISTLFEHADFPNEPLSGKPGSSSNDRDYLIHLYTEDQPETYDMLYQWRQLLDDYQKQHGGDTRVMMTESYASEDKLFGYYGNETHNGAHFTFNFWFITQLTKDSSARDIKFVIDKFFTYLPVQHTPNWVVSVTKQYSNKKRDYLFLI